jgi:hypothetical protein
LPANAIVWIATASSARSIADFMFFILMPECGPTRIVTNYSAFRKRNRSLSFPRVVVAMTEKMSRYRPPESPETLSRCPDPAGRAAFVLFNIIFVVAEWRAKEA